MGRLIVGDRALAEHLGGWPTTVREPLWEIIWSTGSHDECTQGNSLDHTICGARMPRGVVAARAHRGYSHIGSYTGFEGVDHAPSIYNGGAFSGCVPAPPPDFTRPVRAIVASWTDDIVEYLVLFIAPDSTRFAVHRLERESCRVGERLAERTSDVPFRQVSLTETSGESREWILVVGTRGSPDHYTLSRLDDPDTPIGEAELSHGHTYDGCCPRGSLLGGVDADGNSVCLVWSRGRLQPRPPRRDCF